MKPKEFTINPDGTGYFDISDWPFDHTERKKAVLKEDYDKLLAETDRLIAALQFAHELAIVTRKMDINDETYASRAIKNWLEFRR